MKIYFISGTQIDGEHEHSCYSAMNAESKPSWEDCLVRLKQGHLFGYESEEEPGDGLTQIRVEYVEEITAEDLETLERLHIIF